MTPCTNSLTHCNRNGRNSFTRFESYLFEINIFRNESMTYGDCDPTVTHRVIQVSLGITFFWLRELL